MKSPEEQLSIVAPDGTSFQLWTSFNLINSVVRSAEASFEVGDDGSWEDLEELTNIGTEFQVLLNGKPRMKGRTEVQNLPLSCEQSSTVRWVVRTVLADLEIEAAEVSIRTKGRSIKEVVLAALAYAGIDESLVEFRADVSRDLMTGKRSKGAAAPKDIEDLKEEAAAVQPGETVKAFLDRHLRRHGMLIFDGPDGRLVVAEPDDDQEETYFFRCLRGPDGRFNNCKIIDRMKDVTGSPSEIIVFGFGGGKDFQHTKLIGISENTLLLSKAFHRRSVIVDDGVKTKELAQRTAQRAMSERIRRQDCFSLSMDGLSYRERQVLVPYAPDTTCGLIAATIGGAQGKYYIETTAMTVDANAGANTQAQLVKAGTWTL